MNPETPLVSVCIPTFQHASFLAQCLESALSQKTTFRFEIILGEDQSQDGTREICQVYTAKFPDQIRLFLRKEEDKIEIRGRKSGRMNYLENFRSARGKYIAMLDGDDCWMQSDKLQRQVDLLETHPEAFLCSADFYEGEQVPHSISQESSPKLEFYEWKQTTLNTKSYSGHVSNWLFRNDLDEFLSNPLSTKAPILDMLLFTYFKQKGDILHLAEKTSFYRVNKTSYHVQKGLRKNYEDLFWSNWYQFIYLHHNPLKLLRFMGYLGKKILRDRQSTQSQ